MQYEKKNTIITTNVIFGDGESVFYDSIVANAILDRVPHHATVVTITEKLKAAIRQRKIQTELDEFLFIHPIKQVVIFEDGRLEFHFINGLTIDTYFRT